MPDLSSSQLRPYFPGGRGQGKLFPDPKPVDEHRYPRGFTPERSRAVGEALSTVDVQGPPNLQAHLHETLARSTAPVEPIREMKSISAFPGAARTEGLWGRTETMAHPENGSYVATKGTSEVKVYHGTKGSSAVRSPSGKPVSRSEILGATITHELGHVDHALRDPHGYAVTGRGAGGRHEAVADRFMREHFRSDPREVRKGTQLEARDFTYPATGQKVFGYPGWEQLNRQAKERALARTSGSQGPSEPRLANW